VSPDYFARVEAVFLAGAGRGLMLSARDAAIVEGWGRARIPIEVVCAGVEAAFEGTPPARVRSLSYAVPAVEDAIRAWRERRVGASTVPRVVPDEQAALAALASRLGVAAVEPALRGAIETAAASIRGIATGDVSEALADIEARLCDDVLAALVEPARATIEARVDAQLAGQRADPAVRRAQLWRAVREEVGVPALVLHREAW